jgi:hypothetical protein
VLVSLVMVGLVVPASALSHVERSYEIIDSRCENSYARGFLLYEIYTRAAGFDSLTGGG